MFILREDRKTWSTTQNKCAIFYFSSNSFNFEMVTNVFIIFSPSDFKENMLLFSIKILSFIYLIWLILVLKPWKWWKPSGIILAVILRLCPSG